MKIIHEFITPEQFGGTPAHHLWIGKSREYHYICSQEDKENAPKNCMLISAKEAMLLIIKGAEFADDWMAEEHSKSLWRANA